MGILSPEKSEFLGIWCVVFLCCHTNDSSCSKCSTNTVLDSAAVLGVAQFLLGPG